MKKIISSIVSIALIGTAGSAFATVYSDEFHTKKLERKKKEQRQAEQKRYQDRNTKQSQRDYGNNPPAKVNNSERNSGKGTPN